MSTLKYFYDIDNNEENKKLFKGLYIENSSYFKNQGSYPVISISLKDINSNNYNDMISAIHLKFRTYFNKIDSFTNLPSNLLNDYELAKNMANEPFKNMLQIFSEAYYYHYNKKVIILIDEYEAPLLNALQNGYHKEALDFFRTFYSSALKTNPYLEKGILTGITKISQASIFSGLNNFIVYDFQSKDFAQTFGFTPEEVNQALKYYNLEFNQKAIKEFYDGYRIGDYEIYNPWSILNFLNTKELTSYWTKTGQTKIISDMLKHSSNKTKELYKKLIAGEEVFLPSTDPSNLVLDDLNKPDKVFDFMISAGYLNYNNKSYIAKIVNKEVLSSMPDITSEALFEYPSYFTELKRSLAKGYLNNIEELFNDILINNTSFYDIKQNTTESEYHLSFSLMLASLGIGKVISNQEAGLGRFDLVIKPFFEEDFAYVIELKKANNKKEMQKLALYGLNQIKEKQYLNVIKDYQNKIALSICFYKRMVSIKFEIIK